MDPTLPPVLSLIAEDISPLIEGMVFGTPENASGVRILRVHKAIHRPVVTTQRRRVVVPVNRHRQGISGKRAMVGLDPGRYRIHLIKRLSRLG